ncbi:NAD(+)/NADH kinase [Heliophilum fasciatum]|uniref:NAD kinase n=1 Tax=Heliophilum fasciatum TaxID=35700 RepID=A0A4R2RSE5_9FIRM|nr:NAD(+)/NADH kinase [Heliophilum fasciatum]MCW2277345.1 NAD+ kinase [Heliophilum fasciatum]TCP67182.1 NAD+ kinase [Heliophilum fasciatum]
MVTVGVVVNEEKPLAQQVADEMARWFATRQVQMGIPLTNVNQLVMAPTEKLKEVLAPVQWVVALGGDGTLLNTARLVAPLGIPVLGVNLGRLGFLTEIDVADLFSTLERMLQGDYQIEERMMLQAQIRHEGELGPVFYALNDVAITKGSHPRMIRLETSIGNDVVSTYSSDGLLISSPTGSTAYSLSAGGPILSPDVHALLLTYLCPHVMDARPLVVAEDQTVQVAVLTPHMQGMVFFDGQPGIPLVSGDEVIVKKAPFTCKLIKTAGRSFFQILRNKMQQGR